MTKTQEKPTVLVEAVASYQRVGDGPGTTWAQWVLAEATADRVIEDWTLCGEWQASWVQVVVFTFQVRMPANEAGEIASEVAMELAVNTAERIVGESDVQVLGLKVIDSWYVVVTRQDYDGSPWHDGDVVIGPFDTEEQAEEHAQDSADVQDWCYGEAKAKRYIVDDVFWTQTPQVPAHGINAPVMPDPEPDIIRFAAACFLHSSDPYDLDLRALAAALGEDPDSVEAIQ